MSLPAFVAELGRRRVFRTGFVYGLAGWASIEAADVMFPRLALPDWSVTLVVALVLVGFPVALGLAWAFDVAPTGRARAAAPDGPGGIASERADAGEATATLQEPPARAGGAPGEGEAPGGADGRPAVAVLPFANLSPEPDNEYFSDGLTEEVIADLSGVGGLRVTSRTSVLRFKGTERDLRSVARELGVRYVLEGSVRRAGSSLRVTAQLIEAGTDSHLWAEKYAGTMEDVFSIQEEISRKIVEALEVRLTAAENRRVGARPIADLRSYDCYLRARQEIYRWTEESLSRAEHLVDEALALTGENALLLATKGHIYWTYVNGCVRPEQRYLDLAGECARRALALEPEAAYGIFLQGLVAGLRGELEDAVRHLRRAQQQSPGDANVLTELSRYLFDAGQDEASGPVVEELLRIDPLTPISWLCAVAWHLGHGDTEQVLAAGRRMQALLEPHSPLQVHLAWQVLASTGQTDEAVDVLERYASGVTEGPWAALARFLLHALKGDERRAAAAVTPELERAAHWQEHTARVVADGYAVLGHTDRALEWLRVSVARGLSHYPFLARHDPFLESLRTDPRFQELLGGVKRRWEAFEA